jgi:PAS domain S-box-containing protein
VVLRYLESQSLASGLVFEPPLLLPVLNGLFLGIIPFAIAYVSARSYLLTGSRTLLYLGSGLVFLGSASPIAGNLISLPGGANLNVTIYNTGILATSILLFLCTISLRSKISDTQGSRKLRLTAAYSGAVLFVGLFSAAALQGFIPAFFVQGVGPTLLRQAVLGSATVLFALCSLQSARIYHRSRSSFAYWYALGLALITVGLSAVFLQSLVGSLSGWAGRSAQYLGGGYLAIAVLSLRREIAVVGVPLQDALVAFFRESEKNYRLLTETALDAIVSLNPEGRVLLWNRAAERIFGWSRSEAVGSSLVDLIIPIQQAETVREWFGKSATDVMLAKPMEIEAKRKDGSRIIAEMSISSRNSPAGKITTTVIRDITERKRAQQALGESEEKYRKLFEEAVDGIALADADTGILLDCNEALAALVGRKRAELIGQHQAILHPTASDKSAFSPTFKLHATTREGQILETQVVTATGEIREVEIKASLLHLQGRRILQGIFTDITKRKRMEDELRRYSTQLEGLVFERTRKLSESERRFRELSDLLPQIVFEIDENGDVQYMNRAGFEATGLDEEEFGKRHLNASHFLAPAEHERATRGIQRVIAGEMIGEREFTVLRGDGKSFPALVYTAPITREGKAVGLRGIAIDITERKRMEEGLRAAKERLEYVVSSNPAVIFTGKPHSDLTDFDTTYMSRSVISILGYEPREFIDDAKFWERHVHPEDGSRVLAELPRLFKDGHVRYDFRFLHKDGTYRWMHEEVTLVRDAAGSPLEVIGYWTDITERRQMEARLAESQRLAGIGEAAAMVGHDLRNPLQGIVSTVYLAKRKLESPPEPSSEAAVKSGLVDMLETIENEAEYMDKIVSDLQDYAAPLKTEPKPVQMEPLVKDTLSKIRIPHNVKVSFKVSEPLPTVMVDQAVMRRVFTNLITNAIQAMPNGGELRIDAYGTNEFLFIAFKDTGIGIPEENMGKLFNPFFTTKAKGQGLGLPVCKRLVEAHDGRITVKSKPGEGSTFTVNLPIIKP